VVAEVVASMVGVAVAASMVEAVVAVSTVVAEVIGKTSCWFFQKRPICFGRWAFSVGASL
jgi:hypothetical protein